MPSLSAAAADASIDRYRSLSFVSKVTPNEVKSCHQLTAEVFRSSAFVLLLKNK